MKTLASFLKRIASNNWLWGAAAFGCLMTNHTGALVALCSMFIAKSVLAAPSEEETAGDMDSEEPSHCANASLAHGVIIAPTHHALAGTAPGPFDEMSRGDGLFMHELNDLSNP